MCGKLRESNGHSYKSRFRGFESLTQLQYAVEVFSCSDCSNACEIKKVQLEGSEPLYYGSRCDRYNVRKQEQKTGGEDILAWRTKRLFERAKIRTQGSDAGNQNPEKNEPPVVAIPRALITWQLLPLFSQFFQSLGFRVALSGKTTQATIRQGVEAVPAQPCFPVKTAFGHVRELLDTQPDYLFIPCIPSMIPTASDQRYHKLCPYMQSFAFQVQSTFAGRFGRTKLLSGPLYLGSGVSAMRKSFRSLAAQVGIDAKRADAALRTALAAQEAFGSDVRNKGQDILSSLKPNERLFVLVSRPYNGLDEGMNLRLSKKLDAMGVRWIPMEMLDVASAPQTDPGLHQSVYWSYGQKILRAAEIIRRDERLFAIYLTNFGCGPDSFLQTFFTEIMRPKPALLLELDEHSADAGLITRLEAFFESLRHTRPAGQTPVQCVSCGSRSYAIDAGHTLYIPYMGDVSYGFAVLFSGVWSAVTGNADGRRADAQSRAAIHDGQRVSAVCHHHRRNASDT